MPSATRVQFIPDVVLRKSDALCVNTLFHHSHLEPVGRDLGAVGEVLECLSGPLSRAGNQKKTSPFHRLIHRPSLTLSSPLANRPNTVRPTLDRAAAVPDPSAVQLS